MSEKAAIKTVEKIDLFRLHKDEYAKPKTPRLVEVGPAWYLVVRGSGEPGSAVFQDLIGGLFGMAYTIKFMSKDEGCDYTVGKLEGLYGVDGQPIEALGSTPKEEWNWRLMMRVPEFIKAEHLVRARRNLAEKGKEGDFDAVTLEKYEEGLCVQMLHVGPYEDEQRTVAAMHAFAASEGLAPWMWHHETYLSDPRRVPAERLKTILRQPVRKG
ncbi:MAG: GyrI-like domain-containing protein [Phycisphaeraceae bacterium]|nr:MAG: GyrI-like domain-containing protein [Phycisphaeraceae bacterium]